MGLIEYIDKLVTERGSAAVLDKHLAFVREQAQALEKQVTDLQIVNTDLKKRVNDLQVQVASMAALNEFGECRGALFKRKPTGGFHHAVFCPDCHGPMMSLMDEVPFHCTRCKRSVSFAGRDLPTIMQELTCL